MQIAWGVVTFHVIFGPTTSSLDLNMSNITLLLRYLFYDSRTRTNIQERTKWGSTPSCDWGR
jgi:choline-glycine betaine transporter